LKISRKLEKEGIVIDPVKLKDGTAVDYEFSLPVTFKIVS